MGAVPVGVHWHTREAEERKEGAGDGIEPFSFWTTPRVSVCVNLGMLCVHGGAEGLPLW